MWNELVLNASIQSPTELLAAPHPQLSPSFLKTVFPFPDGPISFTHRLAADRALQPDRLIPGFLWTRDDKAVNHDLDELEWQNPALVRRAS